MTHTNLHRIDPDGWPRASTMVRAVVSGGVAYLSGVVPTGRDGQLIGADSPELQAKACLDCLEEILKAAGSSLDDVLRYTCYATTADAASAYIAERSRRMTSRPAATTVLVSALLIPGAMLEVEAIARVQTPS